MRRRTIAISVATVAATILVAGYGAASAVVYDKLTKVTGDCPPAWEGNDPTSFKLYGYDGGPVPHHEFFDTTEYAMPEPEVVMIPSRDAGIEVSGWYIPAAEPDAPTVIVVHGVPPASETMRSCCPLACSTGTGSRSS